MYELLPKNVSPLEVVAVSAIGAVTWMMISNAIAVTIAYIATRQPRAARRSVQASVVQQQAQSTATTHVQIAHSA